MIELSATAEKLLEELKETGIRLSLTGDKLRVQGDLSDELKKQVLKNKEGLIQLVKLGERRWRKVEEWETSWEVTPSNPLEERTVA